MGREVGGHPQTPAKGALPLVESPFSYFVVLAASQHGGLLLDSSPSFDLLPISIIK